MIRVTVDSIRVSLLTQNRVVVLREVESRRYLPIFIGPFEADAIAVALQGLEPQRPMTHDLLKIVFGDLGASIRYILINDLREKTYFARIVANQGTQTLEIDARPSDAIALAIRSDVPIYVDPQVFEAECTRYDDDQEDDEAEDDEVAAELDTPPAQSEKAYDEPATPASDEDLSIFRKFINSLDSNNPKDSSEGA